MISVGKILMGLPFTSIEKLDAIASVKKYNNTCQILFMVWPPMDDTAYQAVKLFKGNKLIYIGEKEGATEDENLANILGLADRYFLNKKIKPEFKLVNKNYTEKLVWYKYLYIYNGKVIK